MMRDRPSYNVWSYKPWWCQPWSIALTAISVTVGSWLLFHRYWVTGMVAVPMLSSSQSSIIQASDRSWGSVGSKGGIG